MASVGVLIPTYERLESLATLAGAASQTVANLHVIVSSQGRHRVVDSAVARAMVHVISSRGGSVERYAPKTVRTPRKTNPIPASHRGVD